MIIHDLHGKRVPVPPYKAHAILIVDSNAVLALSVPMKCFQKVPRRHLEVVERDGSIQDGEFLESPPLQIRRQPAALAETP